MTGQNFIEEVTQKLIKAIENGAEILPWRKGWDSDNKGNILSGIERPFNPTTGTIYKGLNYINLMFSKYDIENDPRFMTFNQANQRGYKITKGSEPLSVSYYSRGTREDTATIIKEDGTAIDIVTDKTYFSPKVYNVYHASCIEGLPKWVKPPPLEVSENFKEIKDLIYNADIKIKTTGTRAFYSKTNHQITMPDMKTFDDEHTYYRTLLHEIGHWTMAPQILDRKFDNLSSEQSYAAEELVAEMFSIFSSPYFRVAPHIHNTTSYIQGWASVLKYDPNFIVKASSLAERALEYACEKAGIDMKQHIQVEQLIYLDEMTFPYYGKSKEDLTPYLNDMLNGRKTATIKGLYNSKTGKTFDAQIMLSKKPDGSIRTKFIFEKNKKTIKVPKKQINRKSKISR